MPLNWVASGAQLGSQLTSWMMWLASQRKPMDAVARVLAESIMEESAAALLSSTRPPRMTREQQSARVIYEGKSRNNLPPWL